MNIRLFKSPKELKSLLRRSVLTALVIATVSTTGLANCTVVKCNQVAAETLNATTQTISNNDYMNSETTIVPIPTPMSTPKVKSIPTSPKHDPLESLSQINSRFSKYGKVNMKGMPGDERDKAMAATWEVMDTPGKPENLTVDITKSMNYKAAEKYVLNMGKYDGVETLSIGKTSQGRNIYMVKVEFAKQGETKEQFDNRPVIMVSGTIHAREGAGAEYSIKGLNDLIKSAQTDLHLKGLLQNVRIVVIPIVNPDGREMIINGGDATRKSNGRGVDLNRNMPALNAGQHAKGVKAFSLVSSKPGLFYYPGDYLGSENESKAMMKWMEVYVPKAKCYIDLHQQGNITYYNKNFLTATSDNLSKAFASNLRKDLNNQYFLTSEADDYGLDGAGGTLTDYARSIAEGMIFSYKYGRLVMKINGEERLLLTIKDVDNAIEYYKPLNKNFVCVSIEIGSGQSYLGYGSKARKLRSNLYTRNNWDEFFMNVTENALGATKIKEIKDQVKKGTISYNPSLDDTLIATTNQLDNLYDFRSQLLYLKSNMPEQLAKTYHKQLYN